MYQRILVATDGSKLSQKAVKSAIELAGALGAELLALYVVPDYPMSYFEGGASIPSEDIGRIEKRWRAEMRSMNPDSKVFVAGHRGMVGSAIARELTRQGFRVRSAAAQSANLHRVLVGPLLDNEDLQKTKRGLDTAGFQAFLKKY